VTLHATPDTLNPTPDTLNPATLNPEREDQAQDLHPHPTPYTLYSVASLDQKLHPEIRNPKPDTRHIDTRHPTPETWTPKVNLKCAQARARTGGDTHAKRTEERLQGQGKWGAVVEGVGGEAVEGRGWGVVAGELY
jgi:hypothetical protein